jgi:hypothetical protein
MQKDRNILLSDLNLLIEAAAYDMQVRNSLIETGEMGKCAYHPTMKAVHDKNLKLLESFLIKYGWPIPSVHGRKAFEAAWLISIHAIEHPQQMIKARDTFKELLDQGEEIAHEYACLYDRIALYTGNKQIYGTQFWPSKTGWRLNNLDKIKNVERNRAQIGLVPLKQSQKWKEMENYEDRSGYIDDEEKIEVELKNWLIQVGWQN